MKCNKMVNFINTGQSRLRLLMIESFKTSFFHFIFPEMIQNFDLDV